MNQVVSPRLDYDWQLLYVTRRFDKIRLLLTHVLKNWVHNQLRVFDMCIRTITQQKTKRLINFSYRGSTT